MEELKKTAKQMVIPGKGVLAADGSPPTIGKRFAEVGLENSEETRRSYREMLFIAPNIGECVSGVILHDETIRQAASDGRSFVDVLKEAGVLPGIKVDLGTEAQDSSPNEKITKGLEGLPERLKEYFDLGARFAKWRAVITIDEEKNLPTDENIRQNAQGLALYAKDCQEAGIVPMVEPEVLMDGSHGIGKCRETTERALKTLFEELGKAGVDIEGVILKPNMVLPGKNSGEESTPSKVAEETLGVFKRTLPESLAGVAFLSGGQGENQATDNLNAMHQAGELPWQLTFSFARALQKSALEAWAGKKENVSVAQEIFMHRAKMNSLASLGKYSRDLERT